MPEPASSNRHRLFGFRLRTEARFANHLGPEPDSSSAHPAELHFAVEPSLPPGGPWSGGELLWQSANRIEPGGDPVRSLLRLPDGAHVIRYPRVADFLIRDDEIRAYSRGTEHAYLIEIRLLGTVLAFWMERRGLVALHASAVVLDGRGVAFLGGNGAGKTSLTAASLASGGALITDDLLALEVSGGELVARPSYPQLRLWPEQAQRFLGAYEHLEKVHPAYEKRRVAVGEDGFGQFAPTSVPIERIYVLGSRRAEGPEIRPIGVAAALVDALGACFAPQLVARAGLEARRLGLLSRWVREASARVLQPAEGLDHLPATLAAVRHDLRSP